MQYEGYRFLSSLINCINWVTAGFSVFACGGLSPCELCALPRKIPDEIITTPLKMALVNACSITNKTFVLNDIIQTKELTFCFDWTWKRTMDNAPFLELCPNDYTFISLPRTSGHVGGPAAVFRKKKCCRMVNVGSFSSFEMQMLFQIGFTNPFYCVLIYSPPGPNNCLEHCRVKLLLI